jgi:hypothetical protein
MSLTLPVLSYELARAVILRVAVVPRVEVLLAPPVIAAPLR